MSQLIEEPRLFENLCSTLYLGIGFILVKRNRGKPGIDGVRIADFEANLDEELSQLQQELSNWTYQPSPVRRVEIPKPGGKGMRLLGIPTVRDRVVQATLKLLLEPIFDPYFSPNSYGFRPGRSQHQAVEAAQRMVNSGKPYVVDIDLSKFFDRIHHDRLIARMGEKVTDKRILRLVGLMLRSGIMINGVVIPSQEGAMQGGPLSPLLGNIVLDELEQHLYRNLVKRGVPRKQASKTVFSNNKRWVLSNARAVTRAYPNSWFINMKGQEIRSDRKLAHWFEVSQWIRLA